MMLNKRDESVSLAPHKPLDGEQGQLELISAEDYFTGSRYVKGLKNIEVVLAH